MRKRTAFILALAALAVGGCSLLPSGGADPPSDEEILVGPTWRMVAIYDSYDGTWHPTIGNGASESILVFEEDGTFVQDEVGGCCRWTGTWSLLGEERELVLHFEDDALGKLEYDVRRLDERELHLAWTGRHGPVINKYRPVDRFGALGHLTRR